MHVLLCNVTTSKKHSKSLRGTQLFLGKSGMTSLCRLNAGGDTAPS